MLNPYTEGEISSLKGGIFVHLGANDLEKEGEWRDNNGEVLSFNKWNLASPSFIYGNNRDYAYLWWDPNGYTRGEAVWMDQHEGYR